jgi:polyhydroxyalkanoate synthesis regulator phasin
MNLEQIVKETVAKLVAEKTLTAAEEKKREEIVMAMKKDFKGPAPAMYAIATDKAKKLAEEGDHEVSMAQRSLDSILRSAMELKAKIGNQEIDIPAWIQDHITNSETYIDQASQGYHEYENGGEHGEMDEGNLNHNEVSSIEQEGRFWIVTYQTADGTKEKSFESEDEARVFYNKLDESLKLNEDKMDKEELKQAQIDKAYDHLEKMKENIKLFSKDDIKKAEARIEKLEAELDALSDKATNESLDEATVRRWQHYAGIK